MADIAVIVTKLADAKAAEERAKAARHRIEEELAKWNRRKLFPSR